MTGEREWDRPIAASARRWREHGWVDEAPALAAIKSLLRAQRMYLTRADRLLEPFALNEARYEVLLAVYLSDGAALGHGEIARRLQISPAAVTGAVDRLHRDGYLAREEVPADRRQKRAVLTDLGRTVVLRATDAMNGQVFGATGLTRAELDRLQTLLGKLGRALHDEPARRL